MECLLSDEGCPWDRKQTHKTLKPYVIEEAHEVCEAVDDEDPAELCGELGDLGLQIVFHAALARREGHFNVDDVYTAICDKLIRRHPHVFGDINAEDAETVLKNWEQIKREERQEKVGENGRQPSALDGVPKALPALQRAQRLQAKAARVGFDWPDVGPVFDKMREEIGELEEEIGGRAAEIGAPALANQPDELPINHARIEDELGDLLFAIVNLARFLKIDPEQALQSTNRKFYRRFRYIEKRLAEKGVQPKDCTLGEMDELWEESKTVLPAENPQP
jgi:tetrapyrrole methylase family protein/MazG family protein